MKRIAAGLCFIISMVLSGGLLAQNNDIVEKKSTEKKLNIKLEEKKSKRLEDQNEY